MKYQIYTTYEGWPLIQNQDPKELVDYGIGVLLLAGKLARILTDFISDFHVSTPDFRNCCTFGLWNLQLPRPNSGTERPSHSTNQRGLESIVDLCPMSFASLGDFGFPRRFQRKNHELSISFL
jgi:hypothetical protein